MISLSRSLPAAPVEGVDYRICDLGNREQIAAVIKTLQEEGLAYIDLLVVNAAVMPGIFMPVAAVDDALEEECFATNLVGAHFLTKYALPLLLASPYSPGSSDGGAGPSAGTIDAPAATVAGKRYSAPAPGFTHSIERTVVYVSSSAGFLEEPEEGNGMLAYRASKAGLNGLMVALHALYVDDSETAVRTRGGPGAPKLQRVVSGTFVVNRPLSREVEGAARETSSMHHAELNPLPFLRCNCCFVLLLDLQCTLALFRLDWGGKPPRLTRTQAMTLLIQLLRRDGVPSVWRRGRTRCCGASAPGTVRCAAASSTRSARCTASEATMLLSRALPRRAKARRCSAYILNGQPRTLTKLASGEEHKLQLKHQFIHKRACSDATTMVPRPRLGQKARSKQHHSSSSGGDNLAASAARSGCT